MNRIIMGSAVLLVSTAGAAHAGVANVQNGNGGNINPNIDVTFSEAHNIWDSADFPGINPGAQGSNRSGVTFQKTFGSSYSFGQQHALTYAYEDVFTSFDVHAAWPFVTPTSEPNVGSGLGVVEMIVNDTGDLWGGYQFSLTGADIYVDCATQTCEFASELDIVSIFDFANDPDSPELTIGDIGFSTAEDLGTVGLEVSMLANAGPIVTLTFENPLAAGASFDLGYVLNYLDINTGGGVVSSSFSLFQQPLPANVIPAPGAAALAMLGIGVAGWFRRKFD